MFMTTKAHTTRQPLITMNIQFNSIQLNLLKEKEPKDRLRGRIKRVKYKIKDRITRQNAPNQDF